MFFFAQDSPTCPMPTSPIFLDLTSADDHRTVLLRTAVLEKIPLIPIMVLQPAGCYSAFVE